MTVPFWLLGLPTMTARRGALILAAGASSRMGTPKAMLPWGETTLLDSAIRTARGVSIEDIVVVLGPSTRHLEVQLSAKVAFNPQPESGRSASIRLGAAVLPQEIGA